MYLLKKMSEMRNNPNLWNGVFFAFFSFINKGFIYFQLLILAKLITPTEYGSLNLFTTLVMLVGFCTCFSTEGYLSVSYFKEGEQGVQQTFSCVFWTSCIVTLVLILIVVEYGTPLSTMLELFPRHLLLAVGIAFFSVFINMNLNIFRLERKIFFFGAFSCGNSLLLFLSSIILVIFYYGWEGAIYAQFFCSFIFGIIAIIFFANRKSFVRPQINHLKMMLCWGFPLIPHFMTTFIRQGCDRYIINYFHSIENVGFFSFALTLANAIIMVGVGFNQSNSVGIFSILGNDSISPMQKKNILTKQNKNLFIVYCFSSIVIFALCMILIPSFFSKYSTAMKFFPILALYAFLHCIYLLYTNFLFFFKTTQKLMYITFSSSVFHLFCSLIFTKYSLYYTSLVYVFSELIIVILVRHVALKLLKKELT